MRKKLSLRVRFCVLLAIAALFILSVGLQAQETTGGLQGVVKDANGAVVPRANVELTGAAQAGAKTTQTEGTGYYRFANLAPGVYTILVKAEGFESLKRDGVTIEVGHLPSLDLALKVGSESTVVEVTGEAPLIDVTVTHTATNVTQDIIADIPHGRSFQSVIQFAPSARNEPLAGALTGNTPNGGTGGSLPGSTGNGLSYGFSVGGASDSENSYLVEGQDTENIGGGYSKANVPFEFIQEVQVKSSGIEAEHGGALGGVVNVIMKKGSNAWHGEAFGTYESSKMNAGPNNWLRYSPNAADSGNPATGLDQASQLYQPTKDHYRFVQPGGTIGGPIVKDRVWFFAGFAPYYTATSRVVDFKANGGNLGKQTFTQDKQLYYGTARIDATVTQKIRVFGSWLTQYGRATGVALPDPDSVNGFTNTTISTPISGYSHGIGYSAPNQTFNVGADITLNPHVVSTTRFGYFFENYHDSGWPTQGTDFNTRVTGTNDWLGNPLPAVLQQPAGNSTIPFTQDFTLRNANKHHQFDQDLAVFKSGWLGTHNLKFGYQYNRLKNDISQNGNVPYVRIYPGRAWAPQTATGVANCAALEAVQVGYPAPECAGLYGYLRVQDFATVGTATDSNHGFFFQDAWTIGKGVTINAGLRIEKETIPAPAGNVLAGHTINFGWGDKLAPRLGAAWDVFQNGKTKVFGSYGVTNDIMKLLLAETSFGGQAYEECAYAMGPGFDPTKASATFAKSRACPSAAPTVGANWAGGATPAGLSLIENVNLRPFEPVAPGVKPFRQHESVFGVDYQLSNNLAFEARWDRRRLDHILEDASLSDVNNGELYTIVNPGEGVNKTIDSYAKYLGSIGQVFGTPGTFFDTAAFGTCPTCPNNPKAVRNYDGLELRLTKAISNHWSGMFSYTYSSLRGNYTGLTGTDQTDGGAAGRNSPDTSRAFDEPSLYFKANGASSNGPLPTDRPNTFKGYAYYQLREGKRNTTTFGLFQTAYQGSPVATYLDVGGALAGQPSDAQYIYGRGKWLDAKNVHVDQTTGAITLVGSPTNRRTPWFNQSDFNLMQEIKVDSNSERHVVGFEVNFTNLLNQHSVTSYYGGLNSTSFATSLSPGSDLTQGAAGYRAIETGYIVNDWINNPVNPVIKSSWYGQPMTHQLGRTIRLKIRYTF